LLTKGPVRHFVRLSFGKIGLDKGLVRQFANSFYFPKLYSKKEREIERVKSGLKSTMLFPSKPSIKKGESVNWRTNRRPIKVSGFAFSSRFAILDELLEFLLFRELFIGFHPFSVGPPLPRFGVPQWPETAS